MTTPETQGGRGETRDCRAVGANRVFGHLRQGQTRNPWLISHVWRTDLPVGVWSYVEDIPTDATHWLVDRGITAVHRMDAPVVISLQLPSWLDQEQGSQIVELLDSSLSNQGGSSG